MICSFRQGERRFSVEGNCEKRFDAGIKRIAVSKRRGFGGDWQIRERPELAGLANAPLTASKEINEVCRNDHCVFLYAGGGGDIFP